MDLKDSRKPLETEVSLPTSQEHFLFSFSCLLHSSSLADKIIWYTCQSVYDLMASSSWPLATSSLSSFMSHCQPTVF